MAGYGPRGSDEAVANIRAAVIPGGPAVLLANHGVLVFHRTPDLAILVGGVVEEAAQAGINAAAIGGPVEIAGELRAAALQRAMAFDSRAHRARLALAGDPRETCAFTSAGFSSCRKWPASSIVTMREG